MSEGFWRGRRVLVTGATGMVGAWLVKELLSRGASVVGLVRDADPQSELYRSGDVRGISVVNGRLEDFSTVERAVNEHGTDVVFHLGAQTIVGAAHRAPLPTFESNIRGTYHLLEACRRHADLVSRVVVASSDKAYGSQPDLPYTEESPLDGRHPYEVSKSCADLLARTYHVTYGLPVAIARCGNIYGGGDLNWSRIVPGTVRSILEGRAPVIRSDGTYVRDYIYVEDVVEAYLRLAERIGEPGVRGEAFNFSTETPLSVLELVERIRGLMDGGAEMEPEVLDVAEGEIQEQYLSAAKARSRLDWTPDHDLEAGLRATIDWYRDLLAGPSASGDRPAPSRPAP